MLYLFEIELGYKPKGLNREQHDTFYAAGESIDDPGVRQAILIHTSCVLKNGEKTHIDGWRIVDRVGDYQVIVVLKESPLQGEPKKLFYANLGGYKQGVKGEQHKELLLVLDGIEQVKPEALKDPFCAEMDKVPGAMPHLDDKMKLGADVDDVFDIEDNLPGYRIILKKAVNPEGWQTTGYKVVKVP